MAWSMSSSRRSDSRRAGGTRPHSEASTEPLSGPLNRITAMADWPAPEATAKMVSASMLAYVIPTSKERNAMAEPANLLRHETSPYLLQHADNPVHWRPWGSAALEEARAQNKPILLSIGYAACHWCHVMAHESFEDPA